MDHRTTSSVAETAGEPARDDSIDWSNEPGDNTGTRPVPLSMDSRMTLAEFFMAENEEVKERGAITREQLAHFVDLTYVATIFNINHLINGCGDENTTVVMLSIAYFFILFTTRYHFDIYSIMFYSIDLVHRCLFLVFNLGVFVMTLNIKFTDISSTTHRSLGSDSAGMMPDSLVTDDAALAEESSGYIAGVCLMNIEYLQGFASGYLTSRITLIAMYSLLIYFAFVNKELESLKTYIVKVVPLFVGSIVMIPIFWESVNPLKILFAVAIIEFLGDTVPEVLLHYLQKHQLNWFRFTISMRPDVDHLQDRLQEFFLIVLGESMIGLLINHFSVASTQGTYVATLFSFTLMFSLGTHFLVSVHRSAEQVHAMKKKNALIRIIYIWLHPVVCYVLLVATNALVQLTETISDSHSIDSEDTPNRLKLTISVGLALTVALMVGMRIMHKGVMDHLKSRGRVYHIIFKFCVALLHLCLYWIVVDQLYFILAHSFLATGTNMVEMLIPLHSRSRTVNFLVHRTTVNSTNAPGAQKELNANRKSVLGKLSTSSSSPRSPSHQTNSSASHPARPDIHIELQPKAVSPLHHTHVHTPLHPAPASSAPAPAVTPTAGEEPAPAPRVRFSADLGQVDLVHDMHEFYESPSSSNGVNV